MAAGIFKNRVTEKDIRQWLDANGFFGRSAEITDLELHAIKRPGWRQVFRFTAKSKLNEEFESSSIVSSAKTTPLDPPASERQTHFGVVLDDQRKGTEGEQTQIFVFDSADERDKVLDDLSQDMLTCCSGQNGDMIVLSAVVVMFVIVALVLGSLVGN